MRAEGDAELFRNLLTGGLNGPVYPINPGASVVQSVVAYPTVLDGLRAQAPAHV